MAIRFEPGVLYSIKEIEDQLAGLMDIRTFLSGMGLSLTGRDRKFEKALWGDEVLNAVATLQMGGMPSKSPAVARAKRPDRKGALEPIEIAEILDSERRQA